MPTMEQVRQAGATAAAARERLAGIMAIDYVTPDHLSKYPKPCMGGWARVGLCVKPEGKVLPCHAAETIPGLVFDNVRDRKLAEIWARGSAFNAYRGTGWMQEPCASCDRREVDWGGCRCQALAWTGDASATDPACTLAPSHAEMRAAALAESEADDDEFVYRSMGGV